MNRIIILSRYLEKSLVTENLMCPFYDFISNCWNIKKHHSPLLTSAHFWTYQHKHNSHL